MEGSARYPAATIELCKYDTELTADAVEWCPAARPRARQLVAVGTYQLNQETGEKYGRVHLVRLQDDAESGSVPSSVALAHVVDTEAILDLKWSCSERASLLAGAAMGFLVPLWTLNEDDDTLEEVNRWEGPDSDAIALSLDWIQSGAAEPSRLAVSATNGTLSVLGITPSSVSLLHHWEAHRAPWGLPAEVWIVASDPHAPSVLWSGGDDATLRGWYLGWGFGGRGGGGRVDGTFVVVFLLPRRAGTTPTFTSGAHEAGVCSAQFHPRREHLCATGSYDQKVLLWDDRRMDEPLSAFDTGGGVWRLKWHPSERFPGWLAAACMRGGCWLLDAGDESSIQPLAHDTGHPSEALSYGIDWCRHDRWIDDDRPVVGSCSFYDHSFRLWRPRDPLRRRE